MPHIGNDIVDLKQPDNLKSSLDSRFLKKVLTAAEIEFVQNENNSVRTLWFFWACKETAYKVIKKIRPDASFLPCQWEVYLSPPARHFVAAKVLVSENQTIYTRLFFNDDYVHCVGSDVAIALDKAVYEVITMPVEKKNETKKDSLFLREYVSRKLVQHFPQGSSNIKIQRDKINGELTPPYILAGETRADVDVSLSHDGRFGAYTFLF